MVKCSRFQLRLRGFKSLIWPLPKVGLGSTKFNTSGMLVFIANWLPSGQLGLLLAAFSINKLISVLICENYWTTRNCVTYSCTTTIYKGIFLAFEVWLWLKSNAIIMVAHSRLCCFLQGALAVSFSIFGTSFLFIDSHFTCKFSVE